MLQKLNLAGCIELAALPSSFGDLSKLQLLDMSGCEMAHLPGSCSKPGSFSKPSSLQAVSLNNSCAVNAKQLKRLHTGGGSLTVYINRRLWIDLGMVERKAPPVPFSTRYMVVRLLLRPFSYLHEPTRPYKSYTQLNLVLATDIDSPV